MVANDNKIMSITSGEAEGNEVFISWTNQYLNPKITPDTANRYLTQNIHMKNNLVNMQSQIFPGEPDIDMVGEDDEIDEAGTKWLRDLLYPLQIYNSMQISWQDCMGHGCSVKSPGFVKGKDKKYTITELRDLPAISFRETPGGFATKGVSNGLMPGIVYDPEMKWVDDKGVEHTGKVRAFQNDGKNSNTTEVENFYIIRDPTTPAPAGLAYCLPVYPVIAMIDLANQAANQQMARTGAPLIFPKIADDAQLTTNIKTWGEQFIKRWGKNTGFVLPPGVDLANPNIHETQNAKLRLEALIGWVNSFFNPTSVLKREGQTLSSSDTAALQIWNNFISGQQAWIEYAYECMLNPLLEPNGYAGKYVRIRLTRPTIDRSQQKIEQLKIGFTAKALTPELIYKNLDALDIPSWSEEYKAQLDEYNASQQPAQDPFGGFGGSPFGQEQFPVGNISPLPPAKLERTEPYREVKSGITEAIQEAKKKVLGALKKSYPNTAPAQKPGLIQNIKDAIFGNAPGEEGTWVTINGTHILIKDGESIGDAFARHTGKPLPAKSYATPDNPDSGGYVKLGDENVWVPGNETGAQTIKRITGEDMLPGENVGQAMDRINKAPKPLAKIVYSDDETPPSTISVKGKLITIHEDETVVDAYKASTGKEMEHTGKSGIDVRHTSSENKPQSDFGHAMFVRGDMERRVAGAYGDVRWTYDRSQGTDINTLKSETIKAWNDDRAAGLFVGEDEYISGKDAFKGFTPSDIVDGAQNWDDGPRTQWFYERIAEPRGIKAVNFGDGSVVFDKSLMKKVPGYK